MNENFFKTFVSTSIALGMLYFGWLGKEIIEHGKEIENIKVKVEVLTTKVK